ncbi:MAG: flagellar motor protein MotB [Gammaproteobacteria bacterium]
MAVESPPIIVKKIKKGGHGHHGGAWKVAFADFVTAMMAFFMLMWLLGSTTPEQKAAIANYMNNPLADTGPGGAGANIVLDGGDGILDGDGPSPFPQAPPSDVEMPNYGMPSPETAEEIAAQAEAERMEELRAELDEVIDASESLKQYKDQLLLDVTPEGLRIQIVDKENRPMFAQGSPVLESYMRDILAEVAKVINQVPNRISISGHTDQSPYASRNGYSNWELSADRANAARRELVSGGIAEEKIGRVVGLASSVLFDKDDPYAPINRRISIIVMNKAAEQAVTEGEGRTPPADDAPESPTEAPPSSPDAAVKPGPEPTAQPLPPAAAAPAPATPVAPGSVAPTPPPAEVPATPVPVPSDGTSPASGTLTPDSPAAPDASPPKAKKIVRIAVGQ